MNKQSRYDIRRRAHGEVIEPLILKEMIEAKILNPLEWAHLYRFTNGQPYFPAFEDVPEIPLDAVGLLKNKYLMDPMAVIIEVKCWRMLNWNEYRDHNIMHPERVAQHERHLRIARRYGLSGVSIVAMNKDSSEIYIRTENTDGKPLDYWCYDF